MIELAPLNEMILIKQYMNGVGYLSLLVFLNKAFKFQPYV